MQTRKIATMVIVAVALTLLLAASFTTAGPPVEEGELSAQAAPLGTAFTYQGRLTDEGGPANGSYDFQFELYDAADDGSQVGSTVTQEDVLVSDGLFTVELDFGSDAFRGDARWLEIGVRLGSSTGAYTILTPRHALTAVPYALYALNGPWSGLTGVPAGFADGVDDDTTYAAGTGLTLVGTTFSADTAYLQRRVTGSCTGGNAIGIINEDGTVTCEPIAGGAGDITAVNAGTGLTGGGQSGDVTLNVDTTAIQQRVSGTCPAGNSVRVINEDGTVTCEPDDDSGGDITAVNAGTGLTGGGQSGDVTLNVNFAGGGTADTAARSNHDHWGEAWSGSGVGLTLNSSDSDGLRIYSPGNDGVYVDSPGNDGVYVNSAGDDGVYVESPGGDGVYVYDPGGHGVHILSAGDDGVQIESPGDDGVHIYGPADDGVHVYGPADDGVYVVNAGDDGIHVESANNDGVEIGSASAHGVRILSAGHDGVHVWSADRDGVRVWSAGNYGVYAHTTATYGFYTPDKIYAGNGYVDIAEHIDAASDVEPGDVVVIDPDHDERVVKSTMPYDTSVAGIISTDPALLIGKSDTETPLALAGRAPCKVSAENGAIHRGDLLTTSSTPGHAMKATEPQLGTILGKALGELESGTGVIVVLVTLQ